MENIFMDDSKPSGLRCPHCAGPLPKESETISRMNIINQCSMIGCLVGGTASAFYGVNRAMPIVQKFVKGPISLQFVVCIPPLLLFSAGCAWLGGAAPPAVADFFISKRTSSSEAAALPAPGSLGNDITESRTSSAL